MARKKKSERERISLYKFMRKFECEDQARQYIEFVRWRNGRNCPRCNSNNTKEATHKTMPYWCKDCRKYFSVKTGTLMEGSNIGYDKWLMAMYLLGTSLKGVASTKLGNDIGISQQSAWFMAHRIRTAWAKNFSDLFGIKVEVDEAYIGGKELNKHKDKKLKAGRGAVGKAPVVGIKERDSKKVKAFHVDDTKARTLHQIIVENVQQGSIVYTDDANAYSGVDKLGFEHETVSHSVGEYVKEQAHINGMESFWSNLKRGYKGVYHKMSVKHLQKYVDEFSNRQNVRELDTMKQIDCTISGLVGKRLKYKELVSGKDGRLNLFGE